MSSSCPAVTDVHLHLHINIRPTKGMLAHSAAFAIIVGVCYHESVLPPYTVSPMFMFLSLLFIVSSMLIVDFAAVRADSAADWKLDKFNRFGSELQPGA